MATMRAVGLLGALLVSLGCGGTRVSSIQQIRETLAMAENYGKIDEEVLAWCEEHPIEAVRVYLRLQIDKEALGLEREISPYSEEYIAL